MLLASFIAFGFFTCLCFCYFFKKITWGEVIYLFLISILIYYCAVNLFYDKATTDKYIVAGYTTSIIHRSAFSYSCSKKKPCYEPERWLLEQSPNFLSENNHTTRKIGYDGTEDCFGECKNRYSTPYRSYEARSNSNGSSVLIEIDFQKAQQIKLGDPSFYLKNYYNPLNVSDDVVYSKEKNPNYYFNLFPLYSYNIVSKILADSATPHDEYIMAQINAKYAQSRISLSLVVTKDSLSYEKLKRVLINGKPNDFMIIIYSPDNKKIENINILGWNNFELKENVTKALSLFKTIDIPKMLQVIDETLYKGPAFVPANLGRVVMRSLPTSITL